MWYALVKGISLGLLLAISVGPLLFTTIKQSINNGTRGGLAFISGIWMSDLILAIAINLFTAVFRMIMSKDIVGVIGSLFLVAVGVYFLFFKKIRINEEGQVHLDMRKGAYIKLFITGFLMNILNPAIILFWLAAATTFSGHEFDQRLIIFGVALLFVLGSDLLKVLLANRIRQRLTPHNIQFISRLNGFILVCFGTGLLIWYLFFPQN
jgi:threonine/homoserine/homoserine lactone efflux protein